MYSTRKHVPDVQAEIYRVIEQNSDSNHTVLVIGRRPVSLPGFWREWGPQCVVVDVLAGEVYPAYAIPEKMVTSLSNKVSNWYFNAFTDFNPTWHMLMPESHVQRYFIQKMVDLSYEMLEHESFSP